MDSKKKARLETTNASLPDSQVRCRKLIYEVNQQYQIFTNAIQNIPLNNKVPHIGRIVKIEKNPKNYGLE